MRREFTATVYIFHETKVLLHLHPKFGMWLPPGGHLEPNETPPEAARREVKEETGLDIVFIEQDHLKVSAYNAISIERPYLCLLENIPAHKDLPAHQHIDLIFLAKPLEMKEVPKAFRWFSLEKLPEEIFPDTRQLLYQRRFCLSPF